MATVEFQQVWAREYIIDNATRSDREWSHTFGVMLKPFGRFAIGRLKYQSYLYPTDPGRRTEGVYEASGEERIRRDKEQDLSRRPARLPNLENFFIEMPEIVRQLESRSFSMGQVMRVGSVGDGSRKWFARRLEVINH